MDSRERVFLALNFEEPDRVPVDFWGSEGFYRSLQQGLDKAAFLDRHDVDFRYIAGPRYVGPPPAVSADGIRTDIWGVPRQTVRVPTQFGEEIYQEVARSPLAAAQTAEEIDAYAHWPSPDWFDYGPVKAQCEAIRSKGRVAVFMGDRLNRVAQLKPAMYLRGVERIFMDLAEAPEIAQAILRHLRRFYVEYLSRVLEAADGGVDIVVTGDDFGSQNAPLLSPAMWRQFLGDGFEEYMTIIRTGGARSMHHTCGRVTPLVGEMAARGLQILQSLQPEAMAADYAFLKSTYGRRLAFQGGVSIQQTLPRGTPEQVREEVRRRVETLAPGGGYILCTAHNIQADCPPANVEALLQAYRQEGKRCHPRRNGTEEYHVRQSGDT